METSPAAPRHPIRPRLRRKIYLMLGGEGHHSRLVRVVDFALMTLISVNCVFSILETVERLSIVHGHIFHDFDLISVGIFSVEYGLRLWTAVEMERYRHPLWGRLRYLCTPLALIDLLAVLPFYLGFFVQLDLRELRVLRLLRVFKLSRYSSAMSIMMAVIRQEARGIGTILFIFLVTLVFVSSLMYLLEHPAQPAVFSDVPSAMWWGVVTMTTLGYGDMVPITAFGRVLGGVTALIGIAMIALPAGILASGFTEQLRMRREDYVQNVEQLLQAGKITARQRRRLEETRIALGLSHDEASHILEHAMKGGDLLCPHCGEPIASGSDHKE
jgi:voltage-gated potassium channel